MSARQQALLMDGDDGQSPVACVPDTYYSCVAGEQRLPFAELSENFSSDITAYTTISGNRAIFTVASGTYGQTLTVASQNAGTIAAIRRTFTEQVTSRLSCVVRVTANNADDSAALVLGGTAGAGVWVVTFRRETAIDSARRLQLAWQNPGGSTTTFIAGAGAGQALVINDWYRLTFSLRIGGFYLTVENLSNPASVEYLISTAAKPILASFLQFSADAGGVTCPTQIADIEFANLFGQTVLLLHAESTPPVDDSCYQEKTVALTGSAVVSVAEKKFGLSSFLVPNVGTSTLNGVQITDHPDFDFGAGDFTIECWAYRNANTYTGYLFYATMGGEFSLRVLTTGLVTIVYRSSGGTQTRTTAVSFPVTQWNFVVVQRRGLNFEFYLNGTLQDTIAVTSGANSTVNSTGDWFWGRTNASSATSWNGYIDEIRVTNGVARYTGAFSLNSLPNCDSAPAAVSGTERLTGVASSVSAGTLRVASPWARLTGASTAVQTGTATATRPDKTAALIGSFFFAVQQGTLLPSNRTAALTGVNIASALRSVTVARYPNLNQSSTSSGIQNIDAVDPDTVFTCVSYFTNGDILVRWYADGAEAWPQSDFFWIFQNQGFNIDDISPQYLILNPTTLTGPIPFATLTSPETYISTYGPMAPLSLPRAMTSDIHFYFFGATSPQVQFAIAPNTNNPRYGEAFYVHYYMHRHDVRIF